jgi:hypothetical protein
VPSIPQPNTSANSTGGLLGKEACGSDATKDCSRCPGAQALTCRFDTTAPGRQMRSDATAAWKTGPRKPPCPRNHDNRSRPRWVHATMRAAMQQSVATHPAQGKARTGMVAHPCGTMHRWMEQGYVLPRGLVPVRGEMRLTSLVYKGKRVLHSLGGEAWIAAGVQRASLLGGRHGGCESEEARHGQCLARHCFRMRMRELQTSAIVLVPPSISVCTRLPWRDNLVKNGVFTQSRPGADGFQRPLLCRVRSYVASASSSSSGLAFDRLWEEGVR